MRPVFELAHVDTCLPDYWSGHHLAHVQIPVRPRMSMGEIKSAIRQELCMGSVMGSSEDARLLSADIVKPDEEKQADAITRAAYAAVSKMKPAKKGQRIFFTELEESDEDGESVYAFFVFVRQD